ncbi:TrmB family transcriptional regulator [Candidatus Woesearchaeota archaeon]|nr:TrmB family transcriptional regulator [Candidatus Woesearchaeota archaeon]
MIMNDTFLKRIRSSFDLNEYEAKIWMALLSKGVATAGELAEISNVPRSRSYDVLESLEKRGFILMKLGKPIKYLAVSPEEVISRVKKTVLQDASQKALVIDTLKDSEFFDDLDLLFKNGVDHVDPTTISGSLRGRRNIYDQIETMLKSAKKSVVISTTEKGLIRKVDSLKYVLKRLAANGVKIRIVAPMTGESESIAKDLKGIATIKELKGMNSRFVLVDEENLIFMLTDDEKIVDKNDIGVWVNTPFFASSLSSLFENAWNKSR